MISLVSLILVSSAIGGVMLFTSRDGGKKGGKDPGGPSYDSGEMDPDENGTTIDEDPYDSRSDNKTDNEDLDSGNDIDKNQTDNNTAPLDPDNNRTGPDDNITNPGNGDNKTTPDDISTEPGSEVNETGTDQNSSGKDNVSPYKLIGSIEIEGMGIFSFEPWKVKTTRPSVFSNGHFSLFDILVYLNHTDDIALQYHYNKTLDTFLIDSIDSEPFWWYWSYYSGGWQESNAWRMDLYPYKDNTTTMVYHEESWMLDRIYDSFSIQVERRAENGDKIIIPSVRIRAPSGNIEFKDVEVTAHNLRNDSFQDGVITAMDVILSLGDQGKITYDLKWYETIGYADPVKNYWVEGINDDRAYGTCGFVYETGEENMGGHNHIHIPSDQRVLTSPEYELWFWICL